MQCQTKNRFSCNHELFRFFSFLFFYMITVIFTCKKGEQQFFAWLAITTFYLSYISLLFLYIVCKWNKSIFSAFEGVVWLSCLIIKIFFVILFSVIVSFTACLHETISCFLTFKNTNQFHKKEGGNVYCLHNKNDAKVIPWKNCHVTSGS